MARLAKIDNISNQDKAYIVNKLTAFLNTSNIPKLRNVLTKMEINKNMEKVK